VLIEHDTFEEGLDGWNTIPLNLHARSSTLSGYIGDVGGRNTTSKTFSLIPIDAESISIRFDVYRFGNWNYNLDSVLIEVDGTTINLGAFGETVSNTEANGIVWWRSPLGGSPENLGEQVNHISMSISQPSFHDGSIKLEIYGNLQTRTAFFGIDNVELVAYYECSCTPTREIYSENFETYPVDVDGVAVREAGWIRGKIDSDAFFTKFLGRFSNDEGDQGLFPEAVFDVPPDADTIIVEFDFYEIDEWTGNDNLAIYLNGERMTLGSFSYEIHELTRSGATARGIEWIKTGGPLVNLGFKPEYKDQVHHVTLRVPQAVSASGQIVIKFEAKMSSNIEKASAGFDNMAVVAEYNCGGTRRPTGQPTPFPTPTPEPIDYGRSISSPMMSQIIPMDMSAVSGCEVVEQEFRVLNSCDAGYYGAKHINILEQNNSTVKFKFTGHTFPNTSLVEVNVWFLDPSKTYEDEDYEQCWLGVQDGANGLFHQEFVAKCEDGWAIVSLSGGDDENYLPFSQIVDPYTPLCPQEVPSFNPQKRCFWQFRIPCSKKDCQATPTPSVAPLDCRSRSLIQDIHPVQVDSCYTESGKSAIQLISQDYDTVTFSVMQKWKGCGTDGGTVGWIATDYIDTVGELECEKVSRVPCGLVDTFTAKCTDGVVVIDLYVFDEQDGLFGQSDGGSLVIPSACNPSGNMQKQCHYRFVLMCEPSLCSRHDEHVESSRRTIPHGDAEGRGNDQVRRERVVKSDNRYEIQYDYDVQEGDTQPDRPQDGRVVKIGSTFAFQ
jgi:hypothetical protein